MNEKRRYSEKEIAEIFKNAASAQESAGRNRSAGEGLSLAELQRIGEESGITPEFIAHAAAMLEDSGTDAVADSLFGVPLVVSRKLSLPRKMENEEWEQLVVDLRRTYGGEGTIKQEGSFRQWQHGEISAFVEPSKEGDVLRITTAPQKVGTTKFSLGLGLSFCILSLVFFIPAFFFGKMMPSVLWPGSLFFFSGLIPLIPFMMSRPWAKKQEAKMNGVVVRVRKQMGLSDVTETDIISEPLAEAETEALSRLDVLENLAEEKSEQRSRPPRLRS
ncbi:MAG: hypothetical protein AB8G77_08825 [Rhodothermales bacterium]